MYSMISKVISEQSAQCIFWTTKTCMLASSLGLIIISSFQKQSFCDEFRLNNHFRQYFMIQIRGIVLLCGDKVLSSDIIIVAETRMLLSGNKLAYSILNNFYFAISLGQDT